MATMPTPISNGQASANAKHVRAVVAQLEVLRVQLTETLKLGEVFRADAEKAVIRGIAFNILSVENHLRMMLQPDQPTDQAEPADSESTSKPAVN